jgi:putative ABC transport system permease protein
LIGSELRWALRAVRARGWQAVLALVLLAAALAANTIVFSAADAFVFRRTPYPSADRLVAIGPVDRAYMLGTVIGTPAVVAWRQQQDVFAEVHGIFPSTEIYAGAEHVAEPIHNVRVTAGLLEMLGARARWGRLLQATDAEIGAPPVAVISEDVARRLFGDARSAVGQRIAADTEIEIVGVVPAAFRYPTARERVWRPLSLDRTNRTTPVNMSNIALLANGVSFEQATFAVAQRGDAVQSATSRRRPEALTLHRFTDLRGETRYRGILLMLTAAAACLLLIACANVASLEVAAGFARSRAMAVHAALGASARQLLRMRLIETALLVGASAAVAAFLARAGAQVVAASLPAAMAEQLSNAIDIDNRAVLFMLAAAACAWAVTLAPTVWRASRTDLMEVLRNDARGQTSHTGAWTRHALVVSQIAATVLLLIGALLYARSYTAKVAVPKGLDSTNLITLTAFGPPASSLRGVALQEAVAETLSRHSAIESVVRADQLMPAPTRGMMGPLLLDKAPSGLTVSIHGFPVAPEYFRMLRIPIIRGELFGAGDPISRVVVDEALAHEFWPGLDPIGRRFGIEGSSIGRTRDDMTGTFEVIGVAAGVRQDHLTFASGVGAFIFYYPVHPQGASASFIARLHDSKQLPAVVSAVRAVAPQAIVRGETMDERYARLEGDLRLAAGVTGGLAALAVIVAALGVYAVMAFIVSGRTREIGIRMALGAGVRDIRREVFAVSMRFVLAGALVGLALSVAATRWIASQLYGVSATDPLTYAGVAAGVFLVAAAATWGPAAAAAKVDPAIALRSQ